MLYPVIFFCIIIFIVILLVKIYILLEYIRDDIDDHLVVSLFAVKGFLKFKYEFPFLDINKEGIRSKKLKKAGKGEKEVGEEDKLFGLNELYKRYKYLKHLIEEKKYIFRYLRRRVKPKELNIKISVGTGEVFLTGVLTGIVWMVVGIIDSYLSNGVKPFKKVVKVETDFTGKDVKIDLYCIFRIKLVHIIVVGIKLIAGILVDKLKPRKSIGGDVSG